MTMNNWLCDIKYNFDIRPVDRLINEVTVGTHPYVFGRTSKPQINDDTNITWNGENNCYNVDVSLLLGRLFDDPDIGFNELQFIYEDKDGNTNTYTLPISETDKYSFEYIEDSVRFGIHTSFQIPFDKITPHETFTLAIKGKYHDGSFSNDLLNDITLPNIELGEMGNDIQLTFLRDNRDVETLNYGTLQSNLPLYYNGRMAIQLKSESGTLTDIDGDQLILRVKEAGKDVQDFFVSENLEYIVDSNTDPKPYIEWIKIGEDINCDGTIDGEWYDTGITFQYEDDFNKEALESAISNNHNSAETFYATKDGNIGFSFNVDPGFSDTSGIQYVNYFEKPYGTESFDIEDYYNLPPEDISINEYDRNGISQFNSDSAYYNNSPDYDLNELPENASEWRSVGVYIQDFAGNFDIRTFDVYYDKKQPAEIDSNGGITKWFADDALVQDNLKFASYDNITKTIRLMLDLTDYSEEEICEIVPVISSPYVRTDIPDSVVYTPDVVTGTEHFGAIDIKLINGFPSNVQLPLGILFTDIAGNERLVSTDVYTPAYLVGSDETSYILPESDEWDETDNKHYYNWTKANESHDLQLYRKLTEETKLKIPDLTDGLQADLITEQYITAHDNVSYELRMLNKSGYESDYPESVITFNREGLNNLPIFTYADAKVFTRADGNIYFGPNSEYTIDYKDFDKDQLTFDVYLNDVWAKEITSVISDIETETLTFKTSELELDFTDDEIYKVEFKLKDSWNKEEVPVTGGNLVISDKTLLYDGTAPALNYDEEKRLGFSYIYGDVHLDIVDTGAGLTERDMTSAPVGTVFTDDTEENEYTHLVSAIPDGEGHVLNFTFTDGVGNINDWATIGPFGKDSEEPDITSASINKTSVNGLYAFSMPHIPISSEWTDNLSGVDRVQYQFKSSDQILKTGEVGISGDTESIESGLWEVICSLSESQVPEGNVSLGIRLIDNGGNGYESDYTVISEKIILDTTKPVIQIAGQSGFSYNSGTYYIGNGPVSLTVDVSEVNPSGTLIYELDDEGVMNTSGNLDSLLSGVGNGKTYSVCVKTSDIAGNEGVSAPFTFTVDRASASSDSFIFNTMNSGPFGKGHQLRFTFSGSDESSGIENFDLWIGKEESGIFNPVITGVLPGHNSDGSLSYSYQEGRIYSLNIPEATDGNYLIRVRAKDYAGNQSDYKLIGGETLGIANSSENLLVNDFSVYSSNKRELKAFFEYEGSKTLNYYSYRVKRKSDDSVVGDWKTTFDNYGTYNFLSDLTEGETYYFEVYAGFSDTSLSNSSYSMGTLVDTGDPEISSLSVPSYGTLSDLALDWVSSDALSPIAQVQARVKTYLYDNDGIQIFDEVVENGVTVQIPLTEEIGLYDLGTVLSGNKVRVFESGSIEIEDGEKLLVSLLVTDLAGNVNEELAGIFIKDSSAPPVPVVLDSGDFLNPLKNSLDFDWQWTQSDIHSETIKYSYQLLSLGNIINENNWINSTEKNHSENLASGYVNGDQLILAVKAENGAGLSSVGYSNGIIVDDTKPEIVVVKLMDNNNQNELSYLLGDVYKLSMTSLDLQSEIEKYVYEAGYFSGTDWISLTDPVETEDTLVSLETPESLPAGEVLYYRATAYNGAGEASTSPGYTMGAKDYSILPLTRNISGSANGDTLRFTWDMEDEIPINSMVLTLRQNGITKKTVNITGKAESHDFESLDDGLYTLAIDYTAANGKSNEDPITSGIFMVDTTKPGVGDFNYNHYVNNEFGYKFGLYDNLSGGAGYRYMLGTAGTPDQLTGGWICLDSSGTQQSGEVSFESDIDGSSITDGSTVIFTLQVKDRCGNWSPVTYTDPILFDKTAPGIPVINFNRVVMSGGTEYENTRNYQTDSEKITRVSLGGSDEQSGILGYKWAVRESGTSTAFNWSEMISSNSSSSSKSINLTEAVLTGNELALVDGKTYEVYVKVLNTTGQESEVGVSPAFLADLSAPEFVFDPANGLDFKDNKFVFNTSGIMNINLVNEESEVVTLKYSYSDTDDVLGEVSEIIKTGTGISVFEIPFSPANVTSYGDYTLYVTMSDGGGRETEASQVIRLNAPPEMSMPDVTSTPMKPFDLVIGDNISDIDDVKDFSVTITSGDFTETHENINVMSLAFDHMSYGDSLTEYTYVVTAHDNYNQESTSTGRILILNTHQGPLFTNEYWSGDHEVYGKVTVPSGITLTLAPDTNVKIMELDEVDIPEIHIDSGGTLIHEGLAVYELLDRTLSKKWEGLVVEGTADLDSITVRDAECGLTLFSDQVEPVKDCYFEDNIIGLHLYGTSPDIDNCSFTGNLYYGVKEDAGSLPVLTNNSFTSNGYDYYDLENTVMNGNDINNLENNSGNTGN